MNVVLLKPGTPSLYTKSNDTRYYKDIVNKLNHVIKNVPWGLAAGMAAPQIGINKRVFIALGKAYINPHIVRYVGEPVSHTEGCFSLEAFDYRSVSRYPTIWIIYKNIKGQRRSERVEGYRAQVIQHEYDHLEGIVIDKKGNR